MVNDTITYLNFTYVTDSQPSGSELTDCEGEVVTRVIDSGGYQFCSVTMSLRDLTIVGVYEEWPFTNPTLLFNPVIVGDMALSESDKTALIANDHGYLGVAIDRSLLPTSSTDDAADWLEDNKKELEGEGYGPDEEIEIRYNDLIAGSLVFFRIFLGLVQVFDYILMIPIVILSFAVLIYGLVLSLEQRKREISIHRVIGGTERGLRGMVLREMTAISIAGWLLGYIVALLSVPLILDAVGFMSFEKGDIDLNPTLGVGYTLVVFLLTVGIAYLVARARTKDFLEMEIDEGVRKVTSVKKPKTWLHVLAFSIGVFASLESYIETSGGWGPFGENGIITGFFVDSLIALLGPFALWIGGALVLGRIGGAAPRIVLKIVGWSKAVADIRRGLRSSGSNESVDRLAVILLLTLSIVTLAAVQGYTGTLVDERTASAQVGADIQVQFEGPVSEDVARQRVESAIANLGAGAIDDIDSMTSVGSTFVTAKEGGGLVPALVLFDDHEDTLIWDEQAAPWDSYGGNMITIGDSARDFFEIEGGSVEIFLPTFTPIFTDSGFEISTTYTSANLQYIGMHEWVPGMTGAESTQAVLMGESTYRTLAGNATVDSHTSTRWFFEVCDQSNDDCKDALERLSAELVNIQGVSVASDWNSAHSEVERNGGLIFGTQGLLSLQFVVASMASVASAFVFLSLVLTQRKKELAILQAIGASPSQIIKLVLFEILAIVGMSMGLGILLGLGIAQSFNGFFDIFGFIFQIFLGSQATVDRTLVWPWMELAIVNAVVLVSVVAALLMVTRRALNSDLAVVLKGE
jgi:ABC-type antimicrobial peptide transport system permease subunit